MTDTSTEADTPLTPTPVAVPRREVGYAATGADVTSWWNTLATERTPQLGWPQLYDVYDDMMIDPQVSSVLRAVMMPILGTGWRLDGRGCRDEVLELVANDTGLPVVGQSDVTSEDSPVEDRFSWTEHLEVALEEMLGYGHSYHEQKAYFGDDGRWHLQKLAWRPPRSIAKFNVARDGGLISIEQRPPSSTNGIYTAAGATRNIVLPVSRLVAYVHGRKGGNWIGRSLLRPAYGPWLLNNRAKRVELIVVERQGAPLVTYVGAESEKGKDLDKGEQIAMGVRAGQIAGAAIPFSAQLRQDGVTGTLPDIGKIKTYNDDLIARGVLAHFLNLGQQAGTGSYALGATFQDFFTLGLQAVAELVRRTGSRHVVKDLVSWNWGPGEKAPKLVFDEIGSRQDSIVQAIAVLVSSGVLQPDEDLEQFVRIALGLPPRGGAPVLPIPTPSSTQEAP